MLLLLLLGVDLIWEALRCQLLSSSGRLEGHLLLVGLLLVLELQLLGAQRSELVLERAKMLQLCVSLPRLLLHSLRVVHRERIESRSNDV